MPLDLNQSQLHQDIAAQYSVLFQKPSVAPNYLHAIHPVQIHQYQVKLTYTPNADDSSIADEFDCQTLK